MTCILLPDDQTMFSVYRSRQMLSLLHFYCRDLANYIQSSTLKHNNRLFLTLNHLSTRSLQYTTYRLYNVYEKVKRFWSLYSRTLKRISSLFCSSQLPIKITTKVNQSLNILLYLAVRSLSKVVIIRVMYVSPAQYGDDDNQYYRYYVIQPYEYCLYSKTNM